MNKVLFKGRLYKKMSGPRGRSVLVFTIGFLVMNQKGMFLLTNKVVTSSWQTPTVVCCTTQAIPAKTACCAVFNLFVQFSTLDQT